jgi:hypothetical protein
MAPVVGIQEASLPSKEGGMREMPKPNKVKRICSQCEREFWTILSVRRKYCSRVCYEASRGKPILVTCDYCGREYKVWQCNLLWKHHFCSQDCYLKAKIKPLSIHIRTSKRRQYLRELLIKYHGICALCNSNEYGQPIMHHLISTTESGGDEEGNLCCLHRACHIEFLGKTIVPLLRERQENY